MLDFGRECVTNKNWGGHVPWTLVHAHQTLHSYTRDPDAKAAYWKDPAVWADLKLACERFLVTHPDGTNSARLAYLWQARRCEQWDTIAQQLPLLTSTNFNYFGGRAEFDQMAKTATEKARPSK